MTRKQIKRSTSFQRYYLFCPKRIWYTGSRELAIVFMQTAPVQQLHSKKEAITLQQENLLFKYTN